MESRTKLLGIYLNDYLAAYVGLTRVASRSARSNQGSELGDFLEKLADELGEEKKVLEELMSALSVKTNPLKGAAVWLAERVGSVAKLNGQLTGYSDLSRLIELEALYLGTEAKKSFWSNLRLALTKAPGVAVDFDDLIARSDDQRSQIDEHRRLAARTALT